MKWALTKTDDDIVQNIVVYDGTAEYVPADGLQLVQVNDWIQPGDHVSTPDPGPPPP